MKELLQKLVETEAHIHRYFGYVEDWQVYPIQDHTDYYWYMRDGMVCYGEDADTAFSLDNRYEDEIIDNGVYAKNDFTMINVDTHTDGNKFLFVFDNTKQLLPNFDDSGLDW